MENFERNYAIIKWTVIFCIIGLVIFGSIDYIYKKFDIKHDNFIEQQVENIIEHETGIEIDLSTDDF